MNHFLSSQRADEVERRTGVSRLVRQICVLREQGDPTEAARVEANDLAPAVTQFRREHGEGALTDEELAALFAAETRRVSEATLLADVLIPRLLETWTSLTSAVPRPRAAPLPVADPVPVRRPASAPAGPPAISDLLDAMLAAERMSTRP